MEGKDHFFEISGMFRAKYSDDKRDAVRLKIKCALEKAFEELEFDGTLSEHSQFAGPSWSFSFEELKENPYITGRREKL